MIFLLAHPRRAGRGPGSGPAGPGRSPGTVPRSRRCPSPDTHTGSRGRSGRPKPPAQGARGQLAQGSGREQRGRAVKKAGGRDRGPGAGQREVQVPAFPALVSPVLREHPRRRPSSSSSRLPPLALPSRSPPQAPEGHSGPSVPGNPGSGRELR